MSLLYETDGTTRCGCRALLGVTLLVAACGGDAPAPLDVDEPDTISAAALAYLNRALDIMQANSINRYRITWPSFREAAVSYAGNAQRTSDTYDAIRFALGELGDHHSFLSVPNPSGPATVGFLAPASEPLPASVLAGAVGYVSVGAFSGTTAQATALATDYHRQIESLDTLGMCAWVVDLRGNTGGNMWPMVAGVGPLAGTGVLGYFVDPDSVVSTWTYAAGGSALNGTVLVQATDPYTLRVADPPVAVLTDDRTASSGEATAIAFRGRPDTRSFGEPTWGVSTANRGFPLGDGAVMHLTVSTMADRTGTLYGHQVVPDIQVTGPRTGDPDTDPPLGAAVAWLLEQEACSGTGAPSGR